MAIRGDSPNNLFVPAKKGFINTSDFVAYLKRNGFEVCVSAYPEPHPESEGFDFDLKLLQNKVKAGASKAITQFCFDLPQFDRLVEAIAQKNINVKLIPGIMPVASIKNILRMAERCGIIIPKSVIDRFNGNISQDTKAAKELCLEQIEYLQNLGLNDFHFYTLNRSDLTYSILKEIKANEIHEHKSRNAKSWQEERIKIRN